MGDNEVVDQEVMDVCDRILAKLGIVDRIEENLDKAIKEMGGQGLMTREQVEILLHKAGDN